MQQILFSWRRLLDCPHESIGGWQQLPCERRSLAIEKSKKPVLVICRRKIPSDASLSVFRFVAAVSPTADNLGHPTVKGATG
jgi:hypothetical protein